MAEGQTISCTVEGSRGPSGGRPCPWRQLEGLAARREKRRPLVRPTAAAGGSDSRRRTRQVEEKVGGHPKGSSDVSGYFGCHGRSGGAGCRQETGRRAARGRGAGDRIGRKIHTAGALIARAGIGTGVPGAPPHLDAGHFPGAYRRKGFGFRAHGDSRTRDGAPRAPREGERERDRREEAGRASYASSHE